MQPYRAGSLSATVLADGKLVPQIKTGRQMGTARC
jgi:hypothetical protein